MKTHSSSGLNGHSEKLLDGAGTSNVDLGLKDDVMMATDSGFDDSPGGGSSQGKNALGDADVS
ncbi:hypothetical protein A2837_01775 [Candidatus Kaiserbacteria bacterium RIFCSPHIGHO2_01_FULL_46_22]|uniref:Uncharacterized protein n=1 Tax=Candidatus Kaiserbacteria bacterium RIFCSPHIGHO2_01_FULL_46_22 TaxID=1798475 RepID=A0A1F6BY94_9BACT|nr:MAG: hypothetical protein A2837_01775 [Candidatus Kaiserbacteria bacterium RIFCSPHIGHO2_01_FULL_46_22]